MKSRVFRLAVYRDVLKYLDNYFNSGHRYMYHCLQSSLYSIEGQQISMVHDNMFKIFPELAIDPIFNDRWKTNDDLVECKLKLTNIIKVLEKTDKQY